MDSSKPQFTLKQRKGMEGISDTEMEYLSPEERDKRWAEYAKYVADAKADGSYGEEYEIKIEMEHDPTFNNHFITPCESYFMEIIDLSAPPKERPPKSETQIKLEKEHKEFWDEWSKTHNYDPFEGEGS